MINRTFAAVVAGLVISTAGINASHAQDLATTRVASGLSYPVYATYAPGDESHLFIVEKRGIIKVLDLETGSILSPNFLDIDSIVTGGTSSNNEQGLLSMAFSPNYEDDGYFFVCYTAVAGSGDIYIRRYSVSSSNPYVANSTSGTNIWSFNQPFSNHNGGLIKFGPDGYLYVFSGDGGSANDPSNRAQDLTNQPLGKILRIDVFSDDFPSDSSRNYGIPADNPFASTTGDDEIWAYGMRNPWRCSFDRLTGDLYIGDVGQNAREEITVIGFDFPFGQNGGWRCMEANACTGLSGCTCNSSSLLDPIYSYTHNTGSTGGFCVTGGYVYRGCAIPDLEGTYFFADFSLARLWSLRWNGSTSYTNFTNRYSELSPSIEGSTINQISSFAEDYHGEIYIIDQGSGSSGAIFKIIPDSGEVDCNVPEPLFGDLNNDCKVDGADLGFLLGFWGFRGDYPADLDGNKVVNGKDLGFLLGAWGDVCKKP